MSLLAIVPDPPTSITFVFWGDPQPHVSASLIRSGRLGSSGSSDGRLELQGKIDRITDPARAGTHIGYFADRAEHLRLLQPLLKIGIVRDNVEDQTMDMGLPGPILPNQPNHWCRRFMNVATSEFVRQLPTHDMDAVEVSGLCWAPMAFKSYRSLWWPEFDICSQVTPEKYDIVIAEQVLEHVRHPKQALKNILHMLRAGGVFVVTTPFMYKYHPDPTDYWRWTVEGLKAFLVDAGFEQVETYGWGNLECLTTFLTESPDFDPARHSLENDPQYPIVVWGFARKPASVSDNATPADFRFQPGGANDAAAITERLEAILTELKKMRGDARG